MTGNADRSFYFFDIDDNLLFLPTKIYIWNSEEKTEKTLSSGEFARIQSDLGRVGALAAWSISARTFRDFRDQPDVATDQQSFLVDIRAALAGDALWRGPSWPLLVHAAHHARPIALITARGHSPETIEAGLQLLVSQGLLPQLPPILGIYTVSNPAVRDMLGATDPDMTTASVKKLAIKHAVGIALERYGAAPPHRFGMSDDDPNNVVLAISALRDCKAAHPDKRFFVINTGEHEFVKLEVFAMDHPVTAQRRGEALLNDAQPDAPRGILSEADASAPTAGGNASIYVTDMDRSIAFFTERMGMQLKLRIGNDWAEIDAGRGLVIGLHPARPPDTVAAGARGAINVELAAVGDLDHVVDRLRSRGVEFAGDIESYPAVRLITALDPDGNALILVQQISPPAEA